MRGTERNFEPRLLAERLAEAWRRRAPLETVPEGERPSTLAEAYAVQDALARDLGEPVTGYKAGLASESVMRSFGLQRPVFGFMTAPKMHADGAELGFVIEGPALIEVEVAFVMKRRILPGETPDLAACIGSAHVAFEIVRSRLAHWPSHGVPGFVADSVGFHAFVLGETLGEGPFPEAIDAPAVLECEATVVAPPLAGADRTDPLRSLSAFLQHAGERGITVESGSIVTTGNLVANWIGVPGGLFEGRVGDRKVRCRFATAAAESSSPTVQKAAP